LQERLTGAGFYRSVVDGEYGPHTVAAVVAFHKDLDLERSSTWAAGDWAHLDEYTAPSIPDRPDEPSRIEINHTRQLLYLVLDNKVEAVVPVSTGNGEYFKNYTGKSVAARTPRGDFTVYKNRSGWHMSYLGGMYRPWYFYGGYAIHGSSSVPAYPASHGCVRVTTWDADFLAHQLEIGMPVHVWD
jgi:lipoprotein-anchoring transpeptidase ErfK/SrfK